MRKVRINPNYVGLVVFGIFLIGLLILKNTLFVDFTINYPAVICLALILMTVIVGFLVVPKDEKSFLLPKAIGYGWTPNPRNRFGFLFYLIFIVVLLSSIL